MVLTRFQLLFSCGMPAGTSLGNAREGGYAMAVKQTEIERWGEKRFKPLVMLAQMIATSAESCHEVLVHSQKAGGPWLLYSQTADGITLDAWLEMYRRPRRSEGSILHFLFAPDEPESLHQSLPEWASIRKEFSRELKAEISQQFTTPPTQVERERARAELDRIYEEWHLPSLLDSQSPNDPPENFSQWLAQPEFVFFMSVVVPCMLTFQTSPWELYRQAHGGDVAAHEKLLCIDPEIVGDRFLGKRQFRLAYTNPAKHRFIKQAQSAKRPAAATLREVKFLMGGLMLYCSRQLHECMNGGIMFRILEERMPAAQQANLNKWLKQQRKHFERNGVRCTLTSPDIKSLFDAIARDAGIGLVDRDFSGQRNSLYKRLDRNAALWTKLRETDKTRAA